MKTKSLPVLLSVFAVCAFSAPLFAETSTAYLGVELSTEPLPLLLSKHLQLEQGQGVLIRNIVVDSPADKVGLDKDDIVIQLNDQTVSSFTDLVNYIQAAGIGTEITLTVIQSGTVRDISVRLEARQEQVAWKYPPEVFSSHIWRPGRVFRLEPNQFNIEIPQIPGGFGGHFPHDLIQGLSVSQVYQYQHGSGDDAFTVTIKGRPEQTETEILVKAGEDEYAATVGTVDEIPEAYRAAVLEDLEKSKNYTIDVNSEIDTSHIFHFDPNMASFGVAGDIHLPEDVTKHFPHLKTQEPELEKKVQELQERIEKLEEQMQEKLNRLEKITNEKPEINA